MEQERDMVVVRTKQDGKRSLPRFATYLCLDRRQEISGVRLSRRVSGGGVAMGGFGNTSDQLPVADNMRATFAKERYQHGVSM